MYRTTAEVFVASYYSKLLLALIAKLQPLMPIKRGRTPHTLRPTAAPAPAAAQIVIVGTTVKAVCVLEKQQQ